MDFITTDHEKAPKEGNKMRVRKWIAISGGVFVDSFEWHDEEGSFGRCLRVRKEELKRRCAELDGKKVLITAYYQKNYEKTGELGVLVNIERA